MALVLKNLQVLLSDKSLFGAISIRIDNGDIVTVMGPSGCGKSSLLAAISGTLRHNAKVVGDIRLNDVDVNSLPTESREIGILFQDDLLFPHFDVCQNLLFALPGNMSKTDRFTAVSEALENAGLSGFEKRDIATLSGGQRARISLLRALLAQPKAILLDEPFSKLDTTLRSSFREFVFEQIQKMNIPALQVTHDTADIFNISEKRNKCFFDLRKGEFSTC